MSPKFHLYPSLLDSFAWFKKSEADNALEEFLNKLNRVKTPPSDAILRGVAFENHLTHAARGFALPVVEGRVKCHDTDVSVSLLEQFIDRLRGSARQVFVETVLDCAAGPVRVYGYVDNVMQDTAIDTKTTGAYQFPKYLHSFQRPVYLEALKEQGISQFNFLVTDFKEMYEEPYTYNSSDKDRLIHAVNELVEFIETHRGQITDKKVFGEA